MKRQFQSFCAKLFVNQFLPGGVGGEAARMMWLGRDRGGLGRAAAVVLMDRLSGLFIQLGLSALSLMFLLHQGRVVAHVLTVGLCLALLGTFVVPILFKKLLPSLARQVRRIGKVEFPDEGREAMEFDLAWRETMVDPSRLWRLLLLSFLRQISMLTLLLAAGRAVGASLSIIEAPPVVLLATLSTLAPLTLGNLGVTEGVYALGFVFFGFSAESGVAASLVMRLLVLPVAGLGGWFLTRVGGVANTTPNPTPPPYPS